MSSGIPGYPADQFIGREHELSRLGGLFGRGERLVTIVGPAGIGKTRLALEYLHTLGTARTPVRFCFCDLSEVRDDGGISAAVARSLDVTLEHSQARDANSLVRAINGESPLFLVLDNLEHLSSEAASRAAEWLRTYPALTLLTTSRERLRIPGEVGFELLPLAVPESDANAAEAASVMLFVARARAHVPEFAITNENAAIVASLSRVLDGIPLAIELAAARVGLVGLRDLESRLRSNLDIVARGHRGSVSRHATLRAAVSWSWELLDSAERSVLSQCSVFRGGFSLAAAEAVLAGEGSGPHALDTLHSLSDKSMLRVRPRTDGDPRFDLYFGIREFAAEQQRTPEQALALRRRHAAHYIDAGLEWSQELERTGSAEAQRELALERDNLLAAYEYVWNQGSCSTDGLPRALQAIIALESIFIAHGPIERFAEILDQFYQRSDTSAVEVGLRARGLRARAKALQFMGMLDGAERDIEQAVSLLEGYGDPWTGASILVDSGVLHHQRRHIELARARYEQALLVYEKLGSKRQEARLLGNIGALHHDIRDFEMAEAYYLRALGLLRRLDEPRFEGNVLSNLGVLTHEQGLHDQAGQYFERAEPCLKRAGDVRLLGIARGNWGALEHERGHLHLALELLTAAEKGLAEFGDSASIGLCLGRLAAVKAELESPVESRADLERAERLVDGDEDPLTFTAIQLYDAFRRLRAEVSVSSETIRWVRTKVHRARQPLRNDGTSAEDLSDDVRSALRLLERQVRKAEPLVSLLDGISDAALVIGKDATWFRPPFGMSCSLSRNGAVRRILSALVTAHATADTVGLDLCALRAAGWPGEKMAPEAATNRVHVALAELRRKGLKACIQRQERGYALDPDLVIQVIAEDRPRGNAPESPT